MILAPADVLVLGAGLQGAGIALELARRGIPVTLIDRDPVALNRASLRNEGKIHLGFMYANDRSLDTASLQLDGALRFRAIVARWLGEDGDWLQRSSPFVYLVANDSLVTADRLAEHYEAVEERCVRELERNPELDYLGTRPPRLVRRLASGEIAKHFAPSCFAAGFATEELALDTELLARALRRALDRCPKVTFLPSHAAREIEQEGGSFRVGGVGPAGAWSMRAEQVVNATWERRLALDRQVGIEPPTHLLHRLKFRLIARLPPSLRDTPSASMVLGRYGDLVTRADGTAYLSWYPAGLRGWCHDPEPPEDWDAACRDEAPAALRREIVDGIFAGIEPWFPGVSASEPLRVDAGAIVAIGRSDVDDPASGLHDRSRIGVTSRGGYHTVDTGKLTTAPLFAMETAKRVEARWRARNPAE